MEDVTQEAVALVVAMDREEGYFRGNGGQQEAYRHFYQTPYSEMAMGWEGSGSGWPRADPDIGHLGHSPP